MTLGQALTIIEAQKPIVADKLNPGGGFNTDVSTVQVSKSGEDFYPKNYPVQHGLHFNIGVQRQISDDMVLSVDFVRRVYLNTLLGDLDYNRYNRFINGVRSPVIPVCTSGKAGDPAAGVVRRDDAANGSIPATDARRAPRL